MHPTGLTIATVLLSAVVAATSVVATQQIRPEVELRAAIELETTKGDTKGAIEAYKKLGESADKAIAATALWRLAEFYRKSGDPEARSVYQRIVRDFSGQPEAALAAKTLASLAAERQSTGLTAQRVDVNGVTSVSPDGRHVSVFDDNTTALVRVHELVTGQSRLLSGRQSTLQPPGFADWGVFSRDSKQIAYTRRNDSEKRTELWVADLAGDANPRPLFANQDRAFTTIRPTDWSPDGTKIATIVRRGQSPPSIALFSFRDQTLQIFPATETEGESAVSFSPDGKYLGFTREVEHEGIRQRDVSIVASDGSSHIQVAVHSARDDFAGWSPDGKTLLFMSNRTGSQALYGVGFVDGQVRGGPFVIRAGLDALRVFGVTPSGDLHYISYGAGAQSEVRVAPFDFANGRWASEPITVSGIGIHGGPQWSSTGAHLAHATRNGFANSLSVRSTETGRVRELGLKAGTTLGTFSWSPDGGSLAIVTIGEGGGMFRVDAASGEMSLISPVVGTQQLVVTRWSRDGRTLFYYRVTPGDTPSVTLVARELASGRDVELVRLVDNTNINLIELSPDDTKVYYRRSLPTSTSQINSGAPLTGAVAFIERDLASGAERELIRRSGMGHPNVSPDGRFLVTASRDLSTNTHAVVLIIPVTGDEPRELTQVNAPESVNIVTWAPDSRSVFAVITRRAQTTELIWVPVDGRPVQTVPSIGIAPFSLDIRPDGREIAYMTATPARRTVELWVLKNFLPAQR